MKTNDRSQFGRAVYAARSSARWTQQQTGTACSLTHSAINRAENSPRRPDPPTLRALCTCWPDRTAGLRVLIAHLEDEITRAGRGRSEIDITESDADHDGGPARDLHAIRAHDADLYDRLTRLIARLRAMSSDAAGRSPQPLQAAAEPAPEYGTEPRENKSRPNPPPKPAPMQYPHKQRAKRKQRRPKKS
jgi:transcriptional regulator with XRE-family HTH domain